MQKKLYIFIIFILINIVLKAQLNCREMSFSKQGNIYKEKLETIKSIYVIDKPLIKPRLRNNGIVFTCVGLVTCITGFALVANAGTASYSYSNTNGNVVEEGSPKGGLGGIMIGAGALSSTGGIIMWVLGEKKISREKRRATVSLSFTSVHFSYFL